MENMNKKSGKWLNYFINKGVKIVNEMPKDWIITEGATTAPNGYEWINNNRSMFDGERKTALLKK